MVFNLKVALFLQCVLYWKVLRWVGQNIIGTEKIYPITVNACLNMATRLLELELTEIDFFLGQDFFG